MKNGKKRSGTRWILNLEQVQWRKINVQKCILKYEQYELRGELGLMERMTQVVHYFAMKISPLKCSLLHSTYTISAV